LRLDQLFVSSKGWKENRKRQRLNGQLPSRRIPFSWLYHHSRGMLNSRSRLSRTSMFGAVNHLLVERRGFRFVRKYESNHAILCRPSTDPRERSGPDARHQQRNERRFGLDDIPSHHRVRIAKSHREIPRGIPALQMGSIYGTNDDVDQFEPEAAFAFGSVTKGYCAF
jgi:hypothetical protein